MTTRVISTMYLMNDFVAAQAGLCLIWSEIVKIRFLVIVHNHPLKEAVPMITRWKVVTLNFGGKIDSLEKYDWKIQHLGDSPGFNWREGDCLDFLETPR